MEVMVHVQGVSPSELLPQPKNTKSSKGRVFLFVSVWSSYELASCSGCNPSVSWDYSPVGFTG